MFRAILISSLVALAVAQVPSIHLYSLYDSVGPFNMYSERDIPDLTKYELFYEGSEQNPDYIYCLHGNWILHGAENYTTGSGYSYISEWEWETSGCVKSFTGSRPKSLRMTGVPGSINAPSINFYPGADFEGEHTLVADDIPEVDFTYRSVIVTGRSSYWLLYPAVNYLGYPACVDNTNYNTSSIRVRSVKRHTVRCPCLFCDKVEQKQPNIVRIAKPV
ncbi:uncharacterized protein LOC118435873 [Folsomia candida]|uniref:Uncharacterized protein n=1 Tax=Folsomia candida TaxID=158441 RepID=A0A226EBM9_FOLCA|nr:uncharacterized protein LOC118435873 [Folsomia candida]OXA54850.1 hypothetical protein Fcan01_11579 [Folsomia candida]